MSKSPEYVVVIGAARSGTKFLRDLIGSSSACRTVPYDVNYVWRTGNSRKSHDGLTSSECTDLIAFQIRKNLKALSRWDGRVGSKYIVEKTVSNCLRVPFVEQALGNVRYVHLIRDGREVLESSLRQWNEPVKLGYMLEKARSFPIRNISYALWYMKNIARGMLTRGQGVGIWGVRYRGIEKDMSSNDLMQVCAKQWALCVQTAQRALQKIPPSRCLQIRYEELVEDPSSVDKICQFLDLPDQARVKQYYAESMMRSDHKRWTDLVENPGWESAFEQMTSLLDQLGYLDSQNESDSNVGAAA